LPEEFKQVGPKKTSKMSVESTITFYLIKLEQNRIRKKLIFLSKMMQI